MVSPTERPYSTSDIAKLQANSTDQAAIVGDSIAAFWPQKSISSVLGDSLENLGVAGDTPGNLLWRLNVIHRRQWRAILLIVGVNSAWKSRDCDVASGIEANISRLHEIAPQATIGVLAVLPHDPGLVGSLRFIQPINDRLRQDAGLLNFKFIDPVSVFVDECAGKPECPLLRDWLHPTDAGYHLIEAEVKKFFHN